MTYPNDAPALPGDVIVTFAPPLTARNWLKDPKGCLFKAALYRFQRAERPSANRYAWWATHTRTYLGDGECSNVTTPQARIDRLDPADFDAPCVVVRYQFREQWNDDDVAAMRRLADEMVGRKYDYTQLLEMGLNIIFDEQIKDGARVLHSKKKNVVCSVGSHLLLLAAHESAKKRDPLLPRPLGYYDPVTGKGSAEATSPCLLLSHPITMRIVYRK